VFARHRTLCVGCQEQAEAKSKATRLGSKPVALRKAEAERPKAYIDKSALGPTFRLRGAGNFTGSVGPKKRPQRGAECADAVGNVFSCPMYNP
jgi:hypothetical protein